MSESLNDRPKAGKKTSLSTAQMQPLSCALLVRKRISTSSMGLNLTGPAAELALAPSTAQQRKLLCWVH